MRVPSRPGGARLLEMVRTAQNFAHSVPGLSFGLWAQFPDEGAAIDVVPQMYPHDMPIVMRSAQCRRCYPQLQRLRREDASDAFTGSLSALVIIDRMALSPDGAMDEWLATEALHRPSAAALSLSCQRSVARSARRGLWLGLRGTSRGLQL